MLFYMSQPSASWLYLVLFLILMMQTIQDLKTLEVSNTLMMFMAIICVSISYVQHTNIIQMMVRSSLVGGIFYLLYVITKGEAIGGADVKFMFCCSTLLTIYQSFQMIFCSSLLAIGFFFIVYRRRREVPFIPFLSLGLFITIAFL